MISEKKLLHALFENCRQSNAEISKRTHLSKQAVGYHIQRLENQKVILGYTCGVDKTKLGFQRYVLFFQFLEGADLQSTVSLLRKYPEFSTLIECLGKWDLYLTAWVKSVQHLDVLLMKCTSLLPIKRTSVLQVVCSKMQLYEIMAPNMNRQIQKIRNEKSTIKIDELDNQIIGALKNNAKEPLKNIANMIRLSLPATAKRINRLIKTGVISRLFAALNLSKYGYQEVQFLCNVSAKNYKNIDKIYQHLEHQKEVSYILKTIGEWNLCFSIYISSADDLRRFINSINKEFSGIINDYETLLIGHVI
jgi:Lrp/AsnC family transcriptional regulator, leucine-responsive regulatory protein